MLEAAAMQLGAQRIGASAFKRLLQEGDTRAAEANAVLVEFNGTPAERVLAERAINIEFMKRVVRDAVQNHAQWGDRERKLFSCQICGIVVYSAERFDGGSGQARAFHPGCDGSGHGSVPVLDITQMERDTCLARCPRHALGALFVPAGPLQAIARRMTAVEMVQSNPLAQYVQHICAAAYADESAAGFLICDGVLRENLITWLKARLVEAEEAGVTMHVAGDTAPVTATEEAQVAIATAAAARLWQETTAAAAAEAKAAEAAAEVVVQEPMAESDSAEAAEEEPVAEAAEVQLEAQARAQQLRQWQAFADGELLSSLLPDKPEQDPRVINARDRLTRAIRRLQVLLPSLLSVPWRQGSAEHYSFQLLPSHLSVLPYSRAPWNVDCVHWQQVLPTLKRNRQPVDVPHSWSLATSAPDCSVSILYGLAYMQLGESEQYTEWGHATFRPRQARGDAKPRVTTRAMQGAADGLLEEMRVIAAGKPLSDDTVALSVAAQAMASESNAGPLVVLYTARGDEVNKDARGQASLFWSNGEVERLYSGLPLQRRLQGKQQPTLVLLSNCAGHYMATEPIWTENRARGQSSAARDAQTPAKRTRGEASDLQAPSTRRFDGFFAMWRVGAKWWR